MDHLRVTTETYQRARSEPADFLLIRGTPNPNSKQLSKAMRTSSLSVRRARPLRWPSNLTLVRRIKQDRHLTPDAMDRLPLVRSGAQVVDGSPVEDALQVELLRCVQRLLPPCGCRGRRHLAAAKSVRAVREAGLAL